MNHCATNNNSKRGYILATVLVILVIVTILCGVMISRTTSSTKLIVDELDDYRSHHDMLGARDLALYMARDFVTRVDVNSSFANFAASREPIFEISMDDGRLLRFFIYDAQGTMHLLPESSRNPQAVERLTAALTRLPEPKTEYVRSIGPLEVSVASATRPVMEAIVGDDIQAMSYLQQVQSEGRSVSTPVLRAGLVSAGTEESAASSIASCFTNLPSLWGVVVEAIPATDGASEWYELVILHNDSLAESQVWRPITESRALELGFQPARGSGA